ncbi:SMI1/KNR4 family protein [Gemmata sp. JC717]|uniref:SMI1/KNR4 family protein n=1 Tax=Gemmata algarum TaxID=2975278 RepID=UPI0021BA3E78|nr:SMI1/KNR4 family protein [Gemmata algarum]MDY3557350.1 SMI1/KNR4 family protein [Gemmata algarum]
MQRLFRGCEFSPPTNAARITAAERVLGAALPSDLRYLLLESNGLVGRHGISLVWPVERIETDNLAFRSNPDFRELYMPFDSLLFVGDDGGGDQFGFRILAGEVQPDNVYRWVHENDSRQWFAGELRDYLARALGHDTESD